VIEHGFGQQHGDDGMQSDVNIKPQTELLRKLENIEKVLLALSKQGENPTDLQ